MAYRRLMVPVDLEHVERLGHALDTALDLAEHYGATVIFVAVTGEVPGPVARNPAQFRRKLEAFAGERTRDRSVTAEVRAYVAHDPAVQIDGILQKAVTDVGADLVVMASHIPHVIDSIWPSHAGKLASHTAASIFIVR